MSQAAKNIEHSVNRQLLKISKLRNEDFQFCLTHYALERFLYRLSKSAHVEKFVLKGALLLMSWTQKPYRPTRDVREILTTWKTFNRLCPAFHSIHLILHQPAVQATGLDRFFPGGFKTDFFDILSFTKVNIGR